MAGQWDSCVVRMGGLVGEEGCGSLDGGRRGGSAVKEGEREDIAAMDGGW